MIVSLYSVRPNALADRTSAWTLLLSSQDWRTPELLGRWEDLLQVCGNLNAMYQSPQWWECLQSPESGQRLSIALLQDRAGPPIGIAPLSVERHALQFHFSGHVLGTIGLQAVFVMGGQPILPPEQKHHDDFFAALAMGFPDCQGIALPAVPVDGFLWRYLHCSPAIQDRFLLHMPEGIEQCHTCALPASFEQYLAKFNAKRRYNLKRQVKILRGHGGGKLELRRIESRDDLPVFLEAIEAVAPPSSNAYELTLNQRKYSWYAEWADRGLLRCYTLKCGDDYVAWLRGYQYRGIYHLELTRYGKRFARFSPGTVLLHLVVEDLIRYKPMKMISFGFGDPTYKHQSSNTSLRYARILLLRRSILNRCLQMSHLSFRQLVNFARMHVLTKKRLA